MFFSKKFLLTRPRHGIWLVFFACIPLLSVPTLAQTNFAVLVNDGAWTWFNDPRALFHNGRLFFGYNRSADSKTVLSVLNLQSGGVTELWTSGYSQRDDHDVPGLLVKTDGTMLAIYSRHLSDQYFNYRLSNSTNPVTPADWNAEQHIPNSGDNMTYANPFQLSAESGRIYNFCRNQNYNPTIFTSTDGGNSWSLPQILVQNGNGNIRPYVKYASNYTNRIDFLYTDGHPREVVTNSLYHMYYEGGAFYKTDGTFIKNYADLPILHSASERGSVIYQYSTAAQADPNEWIPGGRSWSWGIANQTNGDPVCVFTVQLTNATGPTAGSDDRIYYYYARWTGTSWQKRFIAQGGRPLYAAENDYAGGICLDPQDPNVIYISSDAADPFDLSSTTNVPLGAHFELWRGVTTDGGLTFNWTAITPSSTVDNLRPYVPRRNGGEPSVLWFRGTYTSYTSFNTEIVGLFTTKIPQTNSASGAWISDADGFWDDSSNWADGIIADGDGNTADFSTLNITTDRTVVLDSSHAIGSLQFGDIFGTQNWFLDSTNDSTLTLAGGASLITVNENTATLSASLAGISGFTKSGAGTLVLAGSNSFSGTLNVDTGSTSANAGAVRITSSAALANVASPITFRNTTGSDAVATFQLDGSGGDIVVTQMFSITCRNNSTTPTFQNLAGTNILAGTNLVQVGGTNVIYRSDAGALLITAPIRYVGTLTAPRFYAFTGDGDAIVTGPILVASNNVTPIGVVKTGNGTLTLAGVNTYTNGTAVNGGTFLVNGRLGLGRVNVNSATLGGTGVLGGVMTLHSGATIAPGTGVTIGTLTVSNSLTFVSDSFCAIKLDKTSSTNDLLKVGSTLTYGGTLSLTNLSGIVTAGDSFKLFSATTYAGAFSSVSPATPGVGLLWDTNSLTANGTLSVLLGSVKPRFDSISSVGTNLVLGGFGGAAGAGFSVWSSTNLLLPLTNWSMIRTGTFDAAGNFCITNHIQLQVPHQFYEISIP